jgi:hypothetical protein
LTHYFKYFFGQHGVRTRLPGIAPEGAVATVIAAQVGERNKDFARIRDYGRLELILDRNSCIEQRGQYLGAASHQTTSQIGSYRLTCNYFSQVA